LQIEVPDHRRCRSNFSGDGIVAQTERHPLGRSDGCADGIRQICKYSTEHFLLGNTFLKSGDCISGNSIHSHGDLERQRLQLLQVVGGELIVGLGCFVIHALALPSKNVSLAETSLICRSCHSLAIAVADGGSNLRRVQLVLTAVDRLAEGIHGTLADLRRI
jgi:hypothetical protein